MATRKIDSLTNPNQHDDLVERHANARLAQVEREKARTYQKNPRESWFGQLIMGVILLITLGLMLLGLFLEMIKAVTVGIHGTAFLIQQPL